MQIDNSLDWSTNFHSPLLFQCFVSKKEKPKNSHQIKWTTLSPSSSQGWLQRYGYLPRTEPGMSVLRSARTMQSAIAAMQRVYGLNVTGTLDEKTKE